VASLGIGGEWAAGASLVAETLPANKRVMGGALLYTSAPAGLFLATFVNDLLTRKVGVLAANPDLSWRAVFLTGLVPAAVAVLIRLKVKEPDVWKPEHAPRIRELFTPELRSRAVGGLAMAIVALVTWWSCSAFIPLVASHLNSEMLPKLDDDALALRRTEFITTATTAFNLGGLIGTLLTVPVATRLGRRPMFLLYFAFGAAAIYSTFGVSMPATLRLYMMFTVGLGVFGVFGSFTFYLPELFPVRLRGTGAGFCYNAGRIVTSAFPFAVAYVGRNGIDPLPILTWVAVAPVVGIVLVLTGVGVETRNSDTTQSATESA
jgi:MFS family permease